MENAAEALKMAGAVLIFVLAISIIILAFGQVRETSDIILTYKDRETEYIEGQDIINDMYYYSNGGTERQVSLETVIPSIFRAYLENYIIVFEGLNDPIYKIKSTLSKNGSGYVDKYTLDLATNSDKVYRNVVLGTDNEKEEFLRGILYRDFAKDQTDFETKFYVKLWNYPSLYNQLKDAKTITEYLGVYYQDDSEKTPDVNKTQKRIITYKIQYY